MDRHGKNKRDFSGSDRLLLLSVFALAIGVLSSVGAWVLLAGIRFFTNLFFFQTISLAASSPADNHLGAWVIAVPALGGLIVGLMARFGSDKIRGHGIPEALEAILFGKSKMSAKVAVLKPLSSGIVIGSGGPFGAEGPIIMTGGAAASLLAQAFHLTSAERKALLVAGACAGMTAVFGTPLAAVLLAVELLLFELRPRSLLPVALACAVAGFLRPLWAEAGPLFPLDTPPPSTIALLSCIAAGLASGALSAAMTYALYLIEDGFTKLPLHWMWWPALGGLAVGLGGWLQPRALGVGYEVIGDLLANHLVLSAAIALLAVKALIWAIALGSGTSGGVLAPLLMIGAGLGCVLGHWLPGGDPRLWALVCMAATLGGTMRAPMMAIVFAFGLTHDANAFLPLLLGCAVAYGFTVIVMPRSILTEKIARRGKHVYREYGVDALERHVVDEVMTHDVRAVPADTPLSVVRDRYFGNGQTQRAYPVVADGKLVAMLDRAQLSLIAANASDDTPIASLLSASPPVYALPTENCRAVASRIAALELERLPVVTDAVSLTLIGIVSRSDLLKPIGQLHEEESRRERAWGRRREAVPRESA
ncbi:MAG: chloride channel protein [Rudaea sp.]|uniref:chloride channel protein n=1 Tax=unclassified Rudaea TaxID=2627037 RepID=UPI0010F67698|nr:MULTISPECIES: chloride channel protein [unclassified Rudaea]MBN8886298.1 chloride channel protein [Rudaea sp.]MBR0344333.1 chloride channel protein [Rudaea sp.]